MKKTIVFAILVVLIAGMMVAGCTSPEVPAPATPVQTAALTTAPTAVQQPSFTLGDHYLQRSYSFSGPADVFTEQFNVDDPSWGIEINVTPLSDNPGVCWFTLDVTDVNTNQTDHYGYGGSFSNSTDQKIPRYQTGSYMFQMKGNLVKVVVTAAKRTP